LRDKGESQADSKKRSAEVVNDIVEVHRVRQLQLYLQSAALQCPGQLVLTKVVLLFHFPVQ
jgi:hypothetical protein